MFRYSLQASPTTFLLLRFHWSRSRRYVSISTIPRCLVQRTAWCLTFNQVWRHAQYSGVSCRRVRRCVWCSLQTSPTEFSVPPRVLQTMLMIYMDSVMGMRWRISQRARCFDVPYRRVRRSTLLQTMLMIYLIFAMGVRWYNSQREFAPYQRVRRSSPHTNISCRWCWWST